MKLAEICLIPRLTALTASAFLFLSGYLQAAPNLPYSDRTHGYSGWDTTVRGDIRTIGMAGAMVGLADTVIGSNSNPAGLAMTLDNTALQLGGNQIRDGMLQSYDQEINTGNFGFGINPYPWGFCFSYWTPSREGQLYHLPALNDDVMADVLVREFRFSIARMLLNDRLSLGGSFILGQAVKSLEFQSKWNMNFSDHSYDTSLNLGALYQLPQRVLLGIDYVLPMTFSGDSQSGTSQGISHFAQPVMTPGILSLGVGWIPNRIFRGGLSLSAVGTTPNVRLLSDDQRAVGRTITLQPRMGGTYTAAEYTHLKVYLTAGTYYETSRIEGARDRVHVTAGLEINPWILNFGWGIDKSYQYVNYIYSAGIDVIRVMRKLEIIPKESQPFEAGLFPTPHSLSDEGLPRPLVQEWHDDGRKEDIIDIGRQIPGRLQDRLFKTGQQIQDLGSNMLDIFKSIPDADLLIVPIPGLPPVEDNGSPYR